MSFSIELEKLTSLDERRKTYMDDISNKINCVEKVLKKSTINFFSINIFTDSEAKCELAWSPTLKRLILINPKNRVSKPLIEHSFIIREIIVNDGHLIKFLSDLNNLYIGIK